MADFLHALVGRLQNLGAFIYILAFVVVYIESLIVLGNFIPGTMFLVFLGFMCYLRIFDFTAMLLVIFAGHVAGELTNYHLGLRRGRTLFHEDSRYLKPALLAKIERRFRDHRLRLIYFGQFIGFVRPYVPLVAGVTHYPLARLEHFREQGVYRWRLSFFAHGQAPPLDLRAIKQGRRAVSTIIASRVDFFSITYHSNL